jgi:hypothetical protein
MIQVSVYPVFCAGEISELFHPGSLNQGLKDTGSQIRVRNKEFRYFYHKKLLLALENMIPNDYPGPGFFPGSRGQKSIGSRIWIRNSVIKIIFSLFAGYPPPRHHSHRLDRQNSEQVSVSDTKRLFRKKWTAKLQRAE